MKIVPAICTRISTLAAILGILGNVQTIRAASATWLATPFNNNWLAAPTTNNWSTGAGTFPGNTAGSGTADIASFTNASTITTINCASAFAIGGIVFDGPNASAYTINTSGGTWRLNTGNATVRVTGSVTNKQTITGSLRQQSTGTTFLISDSTTPSATLNITTGVAVNNSGNSGTLYLGGTNTGPNILGAYTEQTATICGNLIKTNIGNWILTGNSTYHSNTFVLGGTLMLMGSGAIPNSTNIVVSGGTLNVSNTMSNPNNLWVTNFGALVLTNTTVTQSPLTIGTLTTSNSVFHLGVNAASPYTDITVQTALNAGPGITLEIDRVVNLSSPQTFTLINYPGADPNVANFTVTVPPGYAFDTLTASGGSVSVIIYPPVSTSLVWVGATNSVLVSNWDLNKTKNWLDAATLTIPQVYVNPDAVQFNDNASNSVVTLLTTNMPNSLVVNNNSLNYTFNGTGKISGVTSLDKEGGASLTLAENGGDDFGGGITLNGGTLILDNTNSTISGGLTINGGTTAQIGKNDGGGALPSGPIDDEGTLIFSRANNVTVSTTITGGGALTQNGNGTLTLTTTNIYTGPTIVSGGTLALSGGGAISNSASLLVSNATFDVSGIAGTTLLTDLNITNATLNLGNTNVLTAIVVNSFEVDGIVAHSNIINVLSLPVAASYPATITLIKSANPIVLAGGGGNFNFVLGSLPGGSVGSLSESADQTAVLLTLTSGPTGQRPSVIWAGVDNITATTNWSDRLNWQMPGAPGAADNVIFDGTTTLAAGTVNNFVDVNFTVASLTYNQPANGQWHDTQIPAGVTLAVSGTTTVGGLTADGARTSVAMVDAGTLLLNNSLAIGNNGTGGADQNTVLDLSGLTNFVFNASSGTISLGTGNRSAANLLLAGGSNSITASAINANTASSSSSVTGTMTLGAGTNILNVGTFNIAAQRGNCTVQFPASVPTAGLRLRGSAGTDTSRANMVLGNRNAGGSSGTTTGTLSLNGNPVDLKIGTLTVGQCNQATPLTGVGVLNFDTGTIDANAINLAVLSGTGTGNGTITIGAGGRLVVGTGGISLVNNSSTGSATGTFTATGATIISSNSIVKTTTAGTANVSLTDCSVNVVSGTIGTLPAQIDSLTLAGNNTLQITVIAGVTNIAAASVSASGTTTINIASFAGLTGTTQIPLFYYGSGDPFASLALGTVPAGYAIGNGGALVDNTANQTVDIIVTPPAPLIWRGAVGSILNSSWDTSGTLNWLNGATPAAYADGNYVQFDDSASNFVATLTTTLSPTGLTVNNNGSDYVFNGSGKIHGLVSLVKQGSATLILDNTGSNDFTAGVNIAAGTLQVGNNDVNGNLPVTGGIIDDGTLAFNRTDIVTVPNVISGTGGVTQRGTGTNRFIAFNSYGGTTLISSGMIIVTNANSGNSPLGPTTASGSVVITNGGTLDIENGTAQAISFTNTLDTAGKQFFIAGTGVGGNGAIVNNGTANQQSAFQNITLTANATVGGGGRWDMRVPDGKFQPILDLQGFTLTKTGSNQMSMVGLIVTNGGNIVINSGILSFETLSSNNATHITVNPGAVMGHFRQNATLFTAPITLNGGTIRELGGSPGSTNDAPITLTANSFLDLNVNSTNQLRLNGNITELGGSFGLTKTNSTGTFSLAGVNTYSGNTMIVQGTLILANNGSIAQSKLINVSAGATFDASQRNDQTLALNAGQTLSGFGTVLGIVSAASGSTIAPGSASSTGTLTFNSNVTLAGTNTMKVSHVTVATNDVLNLVNPATLTLGGSLNITLLGGSYAAGDSFKLFNAPGGLSGTFAATNLPALPGGLGWDTTNLVNGVLAIIATVNPNPTSITAVVTGSTLSLSWPSDHTGWKLQAQTNTLNGGLNNSAWFDVPGSTSVNSVNISIDSSKGDVFYRLVLP